ncbi:MAG: AAA family ATPase [Candidatus Saccharibacteria bacterium]
MKPTDGSNPHIIIMVGIPGSGKSFFAEQFAATFKAPVVSFNILRSELFSAPTFSDNEDSIINQVANYMLGEIFKTGRTIIYEGLANQRNERTEIARKARDAGYDPLFVWVQTEPNSAQKRSIKPVDGRPAMTSEQFTSRLKQFSPPHISECAVVISGKHTYNSQLKIVLKSIVTPPPKPIFVSERPARTSNRLIR